MKNNVLLITGANGFLARAVIRQIHRYCEWELAALVRPGTTVHSNAYTTYECTNRLICDLENVDVVMHLAACIPSPQDAAPPELTSVNVDLVETLTQAYPNARHVLASSVSVFGTPVSLPLSIDSPPNEPSAYGLSKLAAEKLVRRMSKHAVIRFSSLIGVGMKVGGFIPTVVSSACAGAIHLLGSGERLQNYLDIDDAALMCLQAASSQKNLVALGITERSYSNNEVAGILADLTGASIVHEGDDCSPSFIYESGDAMRFGQPTVRLKESLERMVR